MDAKAHPMTIDINRGQAGTWRGIAKVEGDTLTLCLTLSARAPRPTAFRSKDTIHLLLVLKRSEPEK